MNFKSSSFLIVWYLGILWITYSFLWGTAADKAFDISNKLSKVTPAFFSSSRMQNKERFLVFTKAFAIIFFVFNTVILILVLLKG